MEEERTANDDREDDDREGDGREGHQQSSREGHQRSTSPGVRSLPEATRFARYDQPWQGPKRGKRTLAPEFLERALAHEAERAPQRPPDPYALCSDDAGALRADLGCEPQLSCLACPLVECRYDVAGGLPQAVLLTLDAGVELPDSLAELAAVQAIRRETEQNTRRDAAILRMRDAGRSAMEIAATYGLSKRQVNRVLQRARARVHGAVAS